MFNISLSFYVTIQYHQHQYHQNITAAAITHHHHQLTHSTQIYQLLSQCIGGGNEMDCSMNNKINIQFLLINWLEAIMQQR
jgi:hypothetical protein